MPATGWPHGVLEGTPLAVGETEQRVCALGPLPCAEHRAKCATWTTSLWSPEGRALLGGGHPGLLSYERGDECSRTAWGPAGPTCVHDPVNLHGHVNAVAAVGTAQVRGRVLATLAGCGGRNTAGCSHKHPRARTRSCPPTELWTASVTGTHSRRSINICWRRTHLSKICFSRDGKSQATAYPKSSRCFEQPQSGLDLASSTPY